MDKSTYYKVTDPTLVKEAIQAISEPASQPQREVPSDLFDSIVGYTDVKTLVRYALAATLTAAGLADILFVYEPKFILINEVERLSPEHIGVLNSLMATGIISETKHGKTKELELDTRVFAAGVKVEKLPQDLLSRFTKLHSAHIQSRSLLRYRKGC